MNSGDNYKDSSLSLTNLHFTLAGDTTRYTAPVELPIFAALQDTDGSETLAITIGGVPTGVKFDAGVNNGNGTWTLADRDYYRMVHKKTTWYSFLAPMLAGANDGPTSRPKRS